MYTYSVSDVANALGLTPGALHFYEKEELIVTRKDSRGYREYHVEDFFRILSYTKYRSMEFPMGTIIKQFNGRENDREIIFLRLQEYRDEAAKKADYYSHLADAITQHILSASMINDLLDKYEFNQSPFVKFCYDDECGWISKNRSAQRHVRKWIKAMPMVRLGIIMHSLEPLQAGFGYTVVPESYDTLDLPDALNIQDFPAMTCLHTIVAIGSEFAENPQIVFEKPLEYANSRGLNIAGKPWGHILIAESIEKTKTLYYLELWIPIS